MARFRLSVAAFLVLGVSLTAGCGSSTSPTKPKPATALTGTLTVFAASSLTKSFTALAHQFETAHPGVHVTANFAASSDLATQIGAGAPADVFASADTKNMDRVKANPGISMTPKTFARNKLVIVVAAGNPKKIRTLADLAAANLAVALCDPTVPCGRFAQQALTNAKVKVTAKSLEPSVRAALTKVELGEVDAAIVYVSDAASSKKVDAIQIPDTVNVTTTLTIATINTTKQPRLAEAWIAFLIANKQELVKQYGFIAP